MVYLPCTLPPILFPSFLHCQSLTPPKLSSSPKVHHLVHRHLSVNSAPQQSPPAQQYRLCRLHAGSSRSRQLEMLTVLTGVQVHGFLGGEEDDIPDTHCSRRDGGFSTWKRLHSYIANTKSLLWFQNCIIDGILCTCCGDITPNIAKSEVYAAMNITTLVRGTWVIM